jgi:hypothetical protein
MGSEDLKNELESISPLLNRLKNDKPKGGFIVERQYFQHSYVDIMQSIEAEKNNATIANSPKKASFWERFSWLFAPKMAYSLVGFAAIVVASMLYFKDSKTTAIAALPATEKAAFVNVEDITSDEAEAYIKENINDFDEKIILESEVQVDEKGASKQHPLNENDVDQYLNKVIEQEQLTDEELENLL